MVPLRLNWQQEDNKANTLLRFIFLLCSLNKSKAGKPSFHSTQQQQRMAKTSRVIGIDDTFISAKPWLPSEPCFSFPTEPSISILTVQQNILPNPRPPDSRGVGQSHRDVLPRVPMPSPPGTPKASSSLLSTARLLSCGTFKEQTPPSRDRTSLLLLELSDSKNAALAHSAAQNREEKRTQLFNGNCFWGFGTWHFWKDRRTKLIHWSQLQSKCFYSKQTSVGIHHQLSSQEVQTAETPEPFTSVPRGRPSYISSCFGKKDPKYWWCFLQTANWKGLHASVFSQLAAWRASLTFYLLINLIKHPKHTGSLEHVDLTPLLYHIISTACGFIALKKQQLTEVRTPAALQLRCNSTQCSRPEAKTCISSLHRSPQPGTTADGHEAMTYPAAIRRVHVELRPFSITNNDGQCSVPEERNTAVATAAHSSE